MKPPAIVPDEIHVVKYPFVRVKYDTLPDDYEADPVAVDSWQPGVRFESDGFHGSEAFADAMGFMTLAVVAVVKPGKYPERVFYVRQWQDPAGHVFGKTQLRMTTTSRFRRIASGYQHDFEMSVPA